MKKETKTNEKAIISEKSEGLGLNNGKKEASLHMEQRKINCIVVDDSNLARMELKLLIAQVDFLNLVKECENPVEAFNYLQKEPVDLVFLDVEMPGMTGIDMIKNLEKRPMIILNSAKTTYAVEAFELNVVDYIVKPVDISRFLKTVQRAKELFDASNQKMELNDKEKDYIFVRANSILTKIKISDITYMQALGDYVNIFTTDKRFVVHITLRSIEEKLPKGSFYRMHRSYLVALNQIDRVEENTAYIGKHPLPIGDQFKKQLLVELNLI
jgi:two-component system LytT family response regulator